MSRRPTAEVYRIDWLPGTDLLHGTCHCGAEHTAADPVEMWQWMLGHPAGHDPDPRRPGAAPTSGPGTASATGPAPATAPESTPATAPAPATGPAPDPGPAPAPKDGNA